MEKNSRTEKLRPWLVLVSVAFGMGDWIWKRAEGNGQGVRTAAESAVFIPTDKKPEIDSKSQ
jgi:hypothetical protein